MFKILLATTLLLISFLPNTENKTILEDNIKQQIGRTPRITDEKTYTQPVITTERSESFQPLLTSATAAYFLDIKSGEVLLKKNAEKRLPMASITKLMTALIVMEKLDMNDVLTVPRTSTRLGDSTAGLVYGDRLTTFNLLQGLLINSGSDAALMLAKNISGSEAEFVALMNERATILGLSDTQFTNPVGWDDNGHYSNAHDLAILTSVALRNPTINEIVQKKTAKVVSTAGRTYSLTNTNLLLNDYYLGAKTGTTYDAGQCLASYYKNGDQEIIGVVLNSPDRFSETRQVIEWINNNYIFLPKGER